MKNIYLDNAATTKPLSAILKSSVELAEDNFYNPSALYRGGLKAQKIIKESREKLLKSFPLHNAIFVSCGTEADNTAIFGFFKRGSGVTTEGEHAAVYRSFESLKQKGQTVGYAKLNADGSVNVDSLLSLVDETTNFVSVVHVNNETGAINDVNEIAKRVKEKAPKAIFHSDGVQALGKIKVELSDSIDLYSVSAHKIGGIKGVGALIYRLGLSVPPLIHGGGQEGGSRSGTENLLGIVDFCACAESASASLSENFARAKQLKEIFLQNLNKQKIIVNSSENASPYIISISCEGLRGEVVQHMLEDCGVIVGTGSACSSKNPHSRVLKACGYSAKRLDGALRISFFYDTLPQDVKFAAEKINECADKLGLVMYGK